MINTDRLLHLLADIPELVVHVGEVVLGAARGGVQQQRGGRRGAARGAVGQQHHARQLRRVQRQRRLQAPRRVAGAAGGLALRTRTMCMTNNAETSSSSVEKTESSDQAPNLLLQKYQNGQPMVQQKLVKTNHYEISDRPL